jgi:hypothetical protein
MLGLTLVLKEIQVALVLTGTQVILQETPETQAIVPLDYHKPFRGVAQEMVVMVVQVVQVVRVVLVVRRATGHYVLPLLV